MSNIPSLIELVDSYRRKELEEGNMYHYGRRPEDKRYEFMTIFGKKDEIRYKEIAGIADYTNFGTTGHIVEKNIEQNLLDYKKYSLRIRNRIRRVINENLESGIQKIPLLVEEEKEY